MPLSLHAQFVALHAADGSLTGFGGGLPTKQFLLELEGILQTTDLFATNP
ncbi:MAG: hypothetical protein ACOH1R_12800 [Luteimonas sp.]